MFTAGFGAVEGLLKVSSSNPPSKSTTGAGAGAGAGLGAAALFVDGRVEVELGLGTSSSSPASYSSNPPRRTSSLNELEPPSTPERYKSMMG